MIINYLAKRYWGRVTLIPVVIGCCAFSFAQWLWRSVFSDDTMNAQDRGRLHDIWGWVSNAMLVSWLRLSDPTHPDYGSVYHSLKDILSEWAKLDPQRAVKCLSFLLVCSIILGILGIIAARLIP